MERENIALPDGALGAIRFGSIGLGLALIAATFWAGWSGDDKTAKIALHAYHIGFIYALGLALGAMGFVMIFHQTNAGWSAALRRQFENVMASIWAPAGLFAFLVLMQWAYMTHFKDGDAFLFSWMNTAKYGNDHLLEKKAAYLNVPFFTVRAAAYFIIWIGLAGALYHFSTRQDTDADPRHSYNARKLSSVGLIAFAFTVAFAGFDWLMGLDFHWYSTMFGVYFFAGNAVSSVALVLLICVLLRKFGRMVGHYTEDHQHDMSKLLFAFTVFWAYIGFSQYFLIWYANIPEETAYYLVRKEPGTIWEKLSWALPIGHFILPFLFLLPRPRRRSMGWAALWAVWMLVMHALDLFYVVRPEAGDKFHWADVTGILGPILVMIGFVASRVAANPLIPVNDPRLAESLGHKNYV
ncbi:MAG: quinol:cytochrome C oxidoreductase [Planctomycetes bacterium]|nr:quinol:cytochrome C oxidoreductase [Planctomycetota bacterium]